jgi:hypothetical protein
MKLLYNKEFTKAGWWMKQLKYSWRCFRSSTFPGSTIENSNWSKLFSIWWGNKTGLQMWRVWQKSNTFPFKFVLLNCLNHNGNAFLSFFSFLKKVSRLTLNSWSSYFSLLSAEHHRCAPLCMASECISLFKSIIYIKTTFCLEIAWVYGV